MSSVLNLLNNVDDVVCVTSATPGATRHSTPSRDVPSENTMETSSLGVLLKAAEHVAGPSRYATARTEGYRDTTRCSHLSPAPSSDLPQSSPAAGSSFVRQTPAQKKRERKLRDDPMADVLGPTLIVCKRCHSTIKLSPKSTFDPFHWNKHKERCLKRSNKLIEQKKLEAKEKSRFPKLQTASRSVSKTSSHKESTPPLTPDTEEAHSSFESDHLKEESPVLELSPGPSVQLHIKEPDPEVEDYLSRSHRKIIRELPPLSPEDWKNWSWSHLKRPVWDQSTLFHLGSEGDADGDERMSDPELCLHQVSSAPHPDFDLDDDIS
ncbi:hypothetical protein NEOLEDRAFT_1171891 [Neolentinus lepideus HHB14362 ss-1]|uniref:Uncharacterized protein n=1 Tax=Neolentinus lepideus HHB14362 ss-1 TaxID=1314782 RepID=A0A165PWH8_9AGAM|nr:hypothetical protein NEOLEDRAFT_1171891 [Neolentinus lepideus HHB14362 ss-1]